MKLKPFFILHNASDETFVVSTSSPEFLGAVKENKTLGAIVGLLREETTREQVIDRMKDRFEAPEGVIEKDVDGVILQLQRAGALEMA